MGVSTMKLRASGEAYPQPHEILWYSPLVPLLRTTWATTPSPKRMRIMVPKNSEKASCQVVRILGQRGCFSSAITSPLAASSWVKEPPVWTLWTGTALSLEDSETESCEGRRMDM